MNGKVTLYGPDGRPVSMRTLTGERAKPSHVGLRRSWRYETIASGLTPERLASVLREADEGNPRDFLILAEEMEERDLHYGSVLATRKRAVARLKPMVEAASEDAADVEMADAVREVVSGPGFSGMLMDALDALGKGYSAVEIIWSHGDHWKPERYEWRDPRWFVPDRDDGRTLRLYDDEDPVYGVPLEPYKWIQFIPLIKSGLPIRGGLARLAAIAYLCKAYSLTDWVRYSEIFGQPFRIGKYGQEATEEDIGKLLAALANLGTDAAAAIPESMEVEFKADSGGSSGGGLTYEKLCLYLDRQVSKGVIGQTMTADEGSSRAQAQVHDLVRQEITESDGGQLAACMNRDLVNPFIDLNYGPQNVYPRLSLPLPDSGSIQVLTSALAKLVPLGLRVQASVVRDRLGMPEPDDDAEVLGAGAQATPPRSMNLALNRADAVADALDEIEAEALSDWESQTDPIVEPVRKLAAASSSYREFSEGLAGLMDRMDSTELVHRLAAAAFRARGRGDATDA